MLADNRWGMNTAVLLTTYKALIRPIIDYGCMAYRSAKHDTLKQLESIQNTALRTSEGAFRTSPIKSLSYVTGELSLEDRRMRLSLRYAISMATTPNNPAYEIILCNRYYKRKPNTPKPLHKRIYHYLNTLNINLPLITE